MSELTQLANQLIPVPANTEDLFKSDGNTKDIVSEVLATFKESNYQLARLAPHLQISNIHDTCRVIWQLVKYNIAYRVDPPGIQWVRTPRRLWADKVGDCKSYSVFIASCCLHAGIKCCFRFVSFKNGPPTHVYVVVKNAGREIILDAVMPAFNQEKPFHKKWDYNMTRISRLDGFPSNPQIGGGLSTLVNQGQRREVLKQALPGLSMLGIYIFIPGFGNTWVSQAKPLLGTPDDLWSRLPQVIKDKTRKAADSFWDFGDWANIKVENDVFPQLKQNITAQLGMDPAQWWRVQLRQGGIGALNLSNLINRATSFVETATNTTPQGSVITSALSSVKSAIGKLFGGSGITWKRGDPSTWGADPSDWASLGINPLAAIPLQGSGGQSLPVTYISPVQQPVQQPIQQPVQQPIQQPVQQPISQPAQQPVQQSNAGIIPSSGQKDNTMMYVLIAGAALFMMGRK